MTDFKYIYGPVSSWRLGRSLGVDLLSGKCKTCNFDCVYCQVGKTEVFQDKRSIFVRTSDIIKEIKALPKINLDYITFSGSGEPTLAKNLGEVIAEIKKIRGEKIAVLTNSSMLDRADVQNDLALADFVAAKLDSCSDESINALDRPMKGISYENIFKGLVEFRNSYNGIFALQVMFIEWNRDLASALAKEADLIRPDEIQLNTPLRESPVAALSEEDMASIENTFKNACKSDIKIYNVYKGKKKHVKPISEDTTLKRRPCL